MTLPLSGIRVLDLSRVLAGPLATMILGDFGADVLKIERPGSGDESRGWGPPFDSRGESAYYLCCNRNKLSVAADLDDERDQALLRGLIAGADVVVDNFRVGTLAKRALDPAASARGTSGASSGARSRGSAPRARGRGTTSSCRRNRDGCRSRETLDGAPMKSGVALVDVITGKDAAIAILAALAGARAARRSSAG